MIIKEAGLVRCLKRAYKSGGYTLREVDNNLCIYAADWFIRVPWRELPNKALAVIVEHAGYTYVGASALHIAKDEEPQEQLEQLVDDELSEWMDQTDSDVVRCIPFTFKNLQLLQVLGGEGQCYGVKPSALDLLDDDVLAVRSAVVMDGPRIIWRAEGELVICKAVRYANDPTAQAKDMMIWKALEQVDFHAKEG